MPKPNYPACPETDPQKWITVAPVISTAHITQRDMALLNMAWLNDHRQSIVAFYDEGVILHWATEDQDEDFEDRFPSERFSPEFCALVRYFCALGYSELRLDADANTVDGLPTCDW